MHVAEPCTYYLVWNVARIKCYLTGSEVAPSWQGMHELAPAPENELAGHGEQDGASAELKVPAAQGEQ